jgi:hypothetical protein
VAKNPTRKIAKFLNAETKKFLNLTLSTLEKKISAIRKSGICLRSNRLIIPKDKNASNEYFLFWIR